MNLNIADDLRGEKNPAALPRRQPPPPVAWVAMASGTGTGGCNSQGQHDPDPRGFTMLSHFRLFPVITRLFPFILDARLSRLSPPLGRKRRFPQPWV